jgi:predicted thioesterase
MAIAWCEAATIAALAPAICSNCTTVGYTIEFAHLSASLVGQEVNAAALVESVSGDRIVFAIELYNAEAPAGKGKITRVRVDQKSWA